MPYVKKAKGLIHDLVKNLERNLSAAKKRNDLLGVLGVTQVLLRADPDHKLASQLEQEARSNLVKTAVALGRPLKENDLCWYKIEGRYAFDGNRVALQGGVLGVGQMTNGVVITCLMKARHPGLAYGWGVQKKVGSPAGSDERFDGTQWVRFAVIADPHVGYWMVEDKVYRPDPIRYTGRLIIYPKGPVELKDVRIYRLK